MAIPAGAVRLMSLLPTSVIQPILYSIAPHTVSEGLAFVPALQDALYRGRTWWKKQLSHDLIPFRPLTTIYEPWPKRFALDAMDIVKQRLTEEGYPIQHGPGNFCPYTYLVFALGGGGYAGTLRWGDEAGIAIVGDACIYGLAGQPAKALSFIKQPSNFTEAHFSVEAQTGALMHELYHSFGLAEHDFTGSPNISGPWWAWPNLGLLSSHKEHILKPPYDVFLVPPLISQPKVEVIEPLEGIDPTRVTIPTGLLKDPAWTRIKALLRKLWPLR